MSSFTDSLRGYGAKTHEDNNYTCCYCGVDGRESFATWLTLTVEHLLPPEHPRRNEEAYKVTACNFCNGAANRYWEQAKKLGLTFDDKTPAELIAQRKPFVMQTRRAYREFWEKNVKEENPVLNE